MPWPHHELLLVVNLKLRPESLLFVIWSDGLVMQLPTNRKNSKKISTKILTLQVSAYSQAWMAPCKLLRRWLATQLIVRSYRLRSALWYASYCLVFVLFFLKLLSLCGSQPYLATPNAHNTLISNVRIWVFFLFFVFPPVPVLCLDSSAEDFL